ncbi:MAG: PepSY domain-containing protein [Planctomycetes bacterium]|nr:PepSY domain-containing protein [Planctomycetota bacterium]
MKHATLLAAALGLAGIAMAQEGRPASDPVSDAWLRFQQDWPADSWRAVWSKATETPSAIYGVGLRMTQGPITSLAAARDVARRVLAERAELLGTGRSQLQESIAQHVGSLWILVYDQFHAGLPVLGGRADVRVNDAGVVSMFGSQLVRIPDAFSVRPVIATTTAVKLAARHLEVAVLTDDSEPTVRLVIHADVLGKVPTTPRLAWEVGADLRSDPNDVKVGKVYVDALTGEVIEWADQVYRCGFGHLHVHGEEAPLGDEHVDCSSTPAPAPIVGNVRSWLNRGAPGDALANTPLQGVRVTASGVGTAFTDANGDFSIPYSGTTAVSVTVNLAGGQRVGGGVLTNQGSAVSATVNATPGVPAMIQLLTPAATATEWTQPTTFWHIDDENRWVTSITGAIPTNRINIANIRATTNIASTCNAYYTANTVNFYAAGGSCNNTGFSSVVYHEVGHGMDDAFGGISQTDGLSEGWGDIMSIYRLDDPIVGRNFTTSGGIVRTALNTVTYPVGGFPGSTPVHTAGQCWMGWAWQVRQGLRASLGTGPGTARAEQIVVGSIAANATNQPNAVLQVFLLDDDDGNLLNGTPNYAVLEAASISRNLPYPVRQLGQIVHTALTSTDKVLKPRVVRATVTPFNGAITDVQVVFDRGSGIVERLPMVPSGNPAEYIALLPGQSSPAAMRYHIEASHSSGGSLRLPATGEYSYAVGLEQVFFADDFEGGALGWTNGLVATQNDWQFGTPTGRSGTSSGVAWRDPAAAASGANCWGNDLGIGNFNGAYQPNVENWLRSPTLNLSGQVGVTLRFKRWLTVEEGTYDQAEIRVNNQVVWTNPASGNLLDTSWVDFELPIPQANNNAAVNIEWRLRTDAGLNLGGWAIDDVRVFSFQATPTPAVTVTLNPAQVPLGGSTVLSIGGPPSAPAAMLLSDSPGPLSLPGLPTLSVGANFLAFPVVLDAGGSFAATLPATSNPNATGTLFYGQAVSVVGGALTTSNETLLLIGN